MPVERISRYRHGRSDKVAREHYFDCALGNPPYNAAGNHVGAYMAPLYPKFMHASNSVSNRVVLVHPARLLFDKGGGGNK